MATAQRENLQVIAGDTLTLDLQLLDGNKDPVTDLVGAHAVMEIRENVLDVTLDASSLAVITTETAMVQFTITDEATDSLLIASDVRKIFEYGCRVIYSDGSAQTILVGSLVVVRGIVE